MDSVEEQIKILKLWKPFCDIERNKQIDNAIEQTLIGYSPFLWCCNTGEFEIVKYLIEHHFKFGKECSIKYNFNQNEIHHAFTMAVTFNNLEIVEWLYEKCNIKDSLYEMEKMCGYNFEFSCKKGYFEIAQWIWSVVKEFNLKSLDFDASHFINILIYTCNTGHKEMVDWLIKCYPNINITDDIFDNIFASMCIAGNKEMAEWLLKYHKNIDILNKIDHFFESACYTAPLEMLKWLRNLNPNINISNGNFIGEVGNDLEKLKWLVEICPTIKFTNDAFIRLCSYGNLDSVKWFIEAANQSKFNYFNISQCSQIIFEYAYISNHLDLIQYLFQIDPTININLNKKIIGSANYNGAVDTTAWLQSLQNSTNI